MGLDSELIVICPVKGTDQKSRVLAVYVSRDYGQTWNIRGQLPAEMALQGYAPAGSVIIADGGYTSEDGISGELEEGAGKARLCCFLQAPVDISNFEKTGPSVLCWSGDNGVSWEAASTVENNSRGISAVFTKGGLGIITGLQLSKLPFQLPEQIFMNHTTEAFTGVMSLQLPIIPHVPGI